MFFKSEVKGFNTGRPDPHLCQGRGYTTFTSPPRPWCISHWALPPCHTVSLPFLIFFLETLWPGLALFCIQIVTGGEGRQSRELLPLKGQGWFYSWGCRSGLLPEGASSVYVHNLISAARATASLTHLWPLKYSHEEHDSPPKETWFQTQESLSLLSGRSGSKW